MEENILEALHSPCLIFDLKGNVLFKNKRLREISPLICNSGEELRNPEEGGIEYSLFNCLSMLIREERHAPLGPIGRPVIFSAKDKDGRELILEVEFSLINWKSDTCVLCILRDISHYKQIELELANKEEFLWLLMFNLPIGLIFVKPDTLLIEDLNLEAANLIGSNREHVLNRKIYEIFKFENDKLFPLEGTIREECFINRVTGEKLPVFLTAKVLTSGESEVIMFAFFDLSERKRLEEQLKNLSITDPLTGVYNRRFFVERLNQEIKRANRYGDIFSVIMLDLDHFKSINDTFGHSKGDEVLIGTANTIKSRIRVTDVLARWGGEEFVILLPSTDLNGATVLANDIREKLHQKDYSIGRKVTCSFGVYQYLPGDTVDSMMTKVDSSLYQAKAAGRDCIKCYLP